MRFWTSDKSDDKQLKILYFHFLFFLHDRIEEILIEIAFHFIHTTSMIALHSSDHSSDPLHV